MLFFTSSSSSSSFSSPLIPTFLLLLLSLPILFLLAPHILPPRPIPISLPEELDDLSLFQNASSSEPSSSSSNPHNPSSKSHLGSTNPKPKIAFLFLTNSNLHFSPLWERFFSSSPSLSHHNHYNIYVHADPTVNINLPTTGVFYNRFIPSKRTQRSSPTLISAARRLLANALLDDSSNAYFALISQHCIPLHSFNYVYHSLFDPKLPKFGSFFDKDLFQYRSFIEILDKQPNLWGRYNARGRNVMLPEVPFDKFRGGSQFFVLSRKHALLVIRERKLWRKFRLPCNKVDSCFAEEHYFPTLLSMEDLNGCTGYTLTRVNWTGTVHGHPHTYRPPEVSAELIYKLRQSNFSSIDYLFARKFSPDCLDPLLEIADSVIFKD